MNKLRQEYCKESGLNYVKPENTEINDYVVWLEKRIETLSTFDVVERFSSEGETLQWLYLNTPFAIKPKSKNSKTRLVNPFTSKHAFEKVCKHLANKLCNAR